MYDITNLRTSVYSSLVNKNYFNFFRNTFENEILNRDNYVLSEPSNIIFDVYSGTKYLITNKCPIGFKVKKENDILLCENNDVLPIIYANNNIMSLREFNSLNYPYNLDAILNYTIIDENKENVYKSNIIKYDLNYEIISKKNLDYKIENNHYLIKAKKNNKLSLKINDLENNILFIKFKMNKVKSGFACSSGITINGITNALSCDKWKYHNNNYTFEYVLDSTDNLDITFTNDSFDLSDFEFYLMNYDKVKDIKNNIKEIKFELVEDNMIEANANLDEPTIIKTTIHYD